MMKETYQVAEVEISYKTKFNILERPKVSHAEQAYNLLMQQWDMDRIELLEEFKVILLNRNLRVLGIVHLSQGGNAGTIVDCKIVFSIALKACASTIMLAHNHPSGNLSPSTVDLNITRKLVEGGKLLDIQVAEHLIISTYGYYSFADNDLM